MENTRFMTKTIAVPNAFAQKLLSVIVAIGDVWKTKWSTTIGCYRVCCFIIYVLRFHTKGFFWDAPQYINGFLL